MIALADCTSFYASCEKVFRPDLQHKALVVLSNNDGCIVARSPEAKALVEMGQPFFKAQALIRKHQIEVFSSNYPLYASLSRRVMRILSRFVPEQEVYSIDECFLDLRNSAQEPYAYALEMQAKVLQLTNIPIRIGIGPNKVLAKVANHLAKQNTQGICCFHTAEEISEALKTYPVQNIWGIGTQSSRLLKSQGIHSAEQLRNQKDPWIKKHLRVVGLRIARELRGEFCLRLEEIKEAKKRIMVSRSFPEAIKDPNLVREKIASFASRVGEKLRQEKQVASLISVFIRSNPFKPSDPPYHNSALYTLAQASNYSPQLIKSALKALDGIFREGIAYKKAGVWVMGLAPESQIQMGIFEENEKQHRQKEKLMQSIDDLNARFTPNLVRSAAMGKGSALRNPQKYLSPRYTSDWAEILKVKI